jgi:protein-serine/threonine kinase
LNKDIISPQGLEREEQKLSENQPSGPVTYEGYDTQNVLHHWRYVRDIGKGNFSVVVLGESTDPIPNPVLSRVAIKIVLLPAHQETRSRIESSLRRELSILKTVNHPSIIKLLSLNVTRQKYLIMTPYYEGGDLFEISSKHRSKMSPLLIRKMFAEIATGIAYLHSKNIVHRDIKLENILINHTINEMLSIKDFTSTSLITITDFGLSREIDPEDPLLTTRCGSEDYVPPELLIGLPYDGRQTDSWALGVLLYSIMESRLPFDPPPVSPNTIRSRKPPKVAHRIARIDWNWYDFKDENMGKTWLEEDWKDAKYIVENLLIRREKRLTSKEVCELEYVSGMLGQEYRA